MQIIRHSNAVRSIPENVCIRFYFIYLNCCFQTFLCGTYPCVEIRPGSMGKAAPGIDLEVSLMLPITIQNGVICK